MKMKLWLWLNLIFLPLYGWAQEDIALLDTARKAYEAGQYETALIAYQTLADKDYTSYELFYNMGNTYFKLGNLGQAILYYERAKKINPQDEDLIFNLELANSQIADKVNALPVSGYTRLLEWVSPDTWGIVSLIFLILGLLCIFLFLYCISISAKRLFLIASIVFLFFMGFAFFLASQSTAHLEKETAVVLAPSATVKSAPGSGGTTLFIVHTGLKVTLLEKSESFVKIKLMDGSVGWVPENVLERI